MTNNESLLLKIDFLLAFIDAKVLLLVWILVDLYRNTIVLEGIVNQHISRQELLEHIWQNTGSDHIIWVPLAVALDIIVKRIVKNMLS